MTETMITRTALAHTDIRETAERLGFETSDVRELLAALNVPMQAEPKPLPAEPGSVIIATEVRGLTGEWRAFLEPDGTWATSERIGPHAWHDPMHITKWTEARLLPVTASPVTLTDDQMGVLWDAVTASDPGASPWVDYSSSHRARFKAVANAVLDQYAAPAEGEPIDLGDVREGDRVRVELVSGDEVTFTVTDAGSSFVRAECNYFLTRNFRTIHLLYREEA